MTAAQDALEEVELTLEQLIARNLDGENDLAIRAAAQRKAAAEREVVRLRAAGPTPHQRQIADATPTLDQDDGQMRGLDGMDIQVEPTRPQQAAELPRGPAAGVMPHADHAAAAAGTGREADVGRVLGQHDVLGRSRGDGLLPDNHPMLFPCCYVSAFPHGRGCRPEGMSESEYFRLIRSREPRRQHAAHPGLLAHTFNLLQRRATGTSARLQTLRYSGGAWDEVALLTKDETDAVAALFHQNARGHAVREALAAAKPAVRELYNAARRVDRHVMGSPGSMASFRSRNTSTWHAFGIWTMAVNLNPFELDEPVVFELAGHAYSFASDGAPRQRPDSAQRWRLLAADPMAEAEFFDLFIRAFADVFLHFPIGAHQQEQRTIACLFDIVLAWSAKPEVSSRKSPHGHLMVCNPRMQPANMQRLLADPATCGGMLGLLERVCQAFLPAPFYAEGMLAAEGDPQHLVALPDRYDKEDRPTACRPPMPPQEWLLERSQGDTTHSQELEACVTLLKQHACRCVLAQQLHMHTHTCNKGGTPTDLNCRLCWPRVPVAATGVSRFGNVDLRRDHPMMVPFMLTLMMAQPMNMAIYPVGDSARWMRQAAIYRCDGEQVEEFDTAAVRA